MSLLEVKVPDIGDFKDIPVIELLVKAGDSVNAEDPLLTLESDKATLEVPAPVGGVVKEVRVKVGDKVLFAKYAGTELKLDGKKLLILRETDLLGIIEAK